MWSERPTRRSRPTQLPGGALVLQDGCEEARQQRARSVLAKHVFWRWWSESLRSAAGGCSWALFLPVPAFWGGGFGRCPWALLRPLIYRVDCAWRSAGGDWPGACRTKKPGCKRACETRQLAQSAQFSCTSLRTQLQAAEMAARTLPGSAADAREEERARERGREGKACVHVAATRGGVCAVELLPPPPRVSGSGQRRRKRTAGRGPSQLPCAGTAAVCGCPDRATLARLALKDALLVHVRTALVPLSALSSPSHPLSPSFFKRQPEPSSCPLSTGLRSCICPFHSLPTTFIVHTRSSISPQQSFLVTVFDTLSHRLPTPQTHLHRTAKQLTQVTLFGLLVDPTHHLDILSNNQTHNTAFQHNQQQPTTQSK